MTQLFADNAASTLASGITDVATSLTLASGHGAKFPSPTGGDYFYATLTQAGAETSSELVKVTARATDTLTIVRAQDGTTGAAWATGDKVELRFNAVTAEWLRDYADHGINEFRLTLTSGLPVTTADVTGATTIYCTPYKGHHIGLYDGTNWVMRSSAEFSKALGTLTSARPYDVFCYDNAGVPTLEFLVWTSASARATALAYQDGVLVKSGDATRRYLGTFYTTATTTTEDSARRRLLWNYYNRVSRRWYLYESTVSWTYTTATWRQARATATNQLECMIGVSEDEVSMSLMVSVVNATATTAALSIGIDSTSTPIDQRGSAFITSAAEITVGLTDMPAAGYHYYAWLEYSTAAGTTTWYGSSSAATKGAGMYGRVFA